MVVLLMSFIEWFKSDIAIVISWGCTVFSTIYAIWQTHKSKMLKQGGEALQNENDSLRAANIKLSAEMVQMNGEKNVYTNTVHGGMKIDM